MRVVSALIVVASPGQQAVTLLEIMGALILGYLIAKTLWWLWAGKLERVEQDRRSGGVEDIADATQEHTWPEEVHPPAENDGEPRDYTRRFSGTLPRHRAVDLGDSTAEMSEVDDEPAGAVSSNGVA